MKRANATLNVSSLYVFSSFDSTLPFVLSVATAKSKNAQDRHSLTE